MIVGVQNSCVFPFLGNSCSHIHCIVRVGCLVFVHHFNGCRTMGAFRVVQWFFFGRGMVWVGVDFHRCRNTRYVTSLLLYPFLVLLLFYTIEYQTKLLRDRNRTNITVRCFICIVHTVKNERWTRCGHSTRCHSIGDSGTTRLRVHGSVQCDRFSNHQHFDWVGIAVDDYRHGTGQLRAAVRAQSVAVRGRVSIQYCRHLFIFVVGCSIDLWTKQSNIDQSQS